MYKQFFTTCFFLLLFISCGPTPFSTTIIMFDKSDYTPTSTSNIVIYNSRLDIPNKYYDIGTIKFKGDPIINKIKELGASKGADGLIKDSDNFILIKFKTNEEIKPNETKSI